MIYYFWCTGTTNHQIDYLKSIGYIEIPPNTCDYEILKVDTTRKNYEIVHKHVPESFNLISEWSQVLFEV